MSRTRRPEHRFPFLERGYVSSTPPRRPDASPDTYSPHSSLKHPPPRFSDTSSPPPLDCPSTQQVEWAHRPRKTPAQRRFSKMLRDGARVLLDLDTGKCLLYSFSNGIRVLGTLTIRMLSQLLRIGDLVLASRENRWIHFVSPDTDVSWFHPEA